MNECQNNPSLIAAWTAEALAGASPPPLDKHLVHKHHAQNVALRRVARQSTSDEFIAELFVDTAHPFFYDHAYDHVPGIFFLEAGRQVATAVVHLFYDVPFDRVFVLSEMNARFMRFASNERPLFLHFSFENIVYRKQELCSATLRGTYVQDGLSVVEQRGSLSVYRRDMLDRLKRRGGLGTVSKGE